MYRSFSVLGRWIVSSLGSIETLTTAGLLHGHWGAFGWCIQPAKHSGENLPWEWGHLQKAFIFLQIPHLKVAVDLCCGHRHGRRFEQHYVDWLKPSIHCRRARLHSRQGAHQARFK